MNTKSSPETTVVETPLQTRMKGWIYVPRGLFLALIIVVLLSLVLTVVTLLQIRTIGAQTAGSAVEMADLQSRLEAQEGKIATVEYNENAMLTQNEQLQADMDTSMGMLMDIAAGLQEQPGGVEAVIPPMHLDFACLDAADQTPVEGCTVQVTVLEATQLREAVYATGEGGLIDLPWRLRLSVSAQAEGYQPAADIFEYVEDGSLQNRQFLLQK